MAEDEISTTDTTSFGMALPFERPSNLHIYRIHYRFSNEQKDQITAEHSAFFSITFFHLNGSQPEKYMSENVVFKGVEKDCLMHSKALTSLLSVFFQPEKNRLAGGSKICDC